MFLNGTHLYYTCSFHNKGPKTLDEANELTTGGDAAKLFKPILRVQILS